MPKIEEDFDQKTEEKQKKETENLNNEKVVTEIHYVKEEHRDGTLGALILITLGIIFLLNNFNILPWSVWGTLWRFWPLFLILCGLQLVLGKSYLAKWIVAIFGLITIAVIVCLSLVSVNSGLHNYMKDRFFWWPEKLFSTSSADLKNQDYVVTKDKYDNVESLDLSIDIGISEFTLSDKESVNYLEVKSSYYDDFGVPKIDENLQNKKLNLDFSTESREFFFDHIFNTGDVKYDLALGSKEIPTNIEIDLGTGKGTVDFNQININSIIAEVGTGTLNLTLGKYALPSSEVSLKIGTGSIKIYLPSDTGIKLTHEIGVGSIKLNQNKISGDGIYTSDNYENSSAKVELDVEVGTGSVEIETE